MVWNYRVIEHKRVFYIHEVYYNDNGDICAMSEDPMQPHGTSLAELKRDRRAFSPGLQQAGAQERED